MSDYFVSIRCGAETKQRFAPGSAGERDFVHECTRAIVAKVRLDRSVDAIVKQGVGIFRTEAQVRRAVATVLAETAGPQLRQAILDGIRDVLHDLKAEVRP